MSTCPSHSSTKLQVNLYPNVARIEGPTPRTVAEALSASTKHFTTHGGVVQVEEGPVEAFYEQADGELVMCSGLVPRLRRELLVHGVHLRISDHSRWLALERADNQWRRRIGLPRLVRELAAELSYRPRGQITYSRATDYEQALSTVIRLYRDLRILVVTPSRKQGRGLARKLTRLSGVFVHSSPKEAFAHDPTTLVTTRYHFEAANSLDWDVILFTDPRSLFSSAAYAKALPAR